MRSAFRQPAPETDHAPIWRRGASLALVILVHLALLLMLLRLAPELVAAKQERRLLTFDVREVGVQAEDESRSKARKPSGGGARRATKPAATPPQPRSSDTPPPPAQSDIWKQIIPMSGADFAAADISRLPSRSRTGDGQSQGSGRGDADGDGDGGGRGPHGETLYAADWYRKASSAELRGYLPKDRSANGWGMIACRTIAGYRVDSCVEIGEGPLGSGLAAAVRRAAWQFRILPPRVNGKPQVGEWVSIRIDYSEVKG
jgi:hypothetical protein